MPVSQTVYSVPQREFTRSQELNFTMGEKEDLLALDRVTAEIRALNRRMAELTQERDDISSRIWGCSYAEACPQGCEI